MFRLRVVHDAWKIIPPNPRHTDDAALKSSGWKCASVKVLTRKALAPPVPPSLCIGVVAVARGVAQRIDLFSHLAIGVITDGRDSAGEIILHELAAGNDLAGRRVVVVLVRDAGRSDGRFHVFEPPRFVIIISDIGIDARPVIHGVAVLAA